MMNIPGNPVGASQRLLTRLGGGFILRVHTTSQLISSLIGPLVGIYFVYITARLSGLQLIQLVISTVCFIVLVDFLHYFYARRITRQARAYLDHIFLKKSLPEARKESVSWEQILTLPRRSAVAQLIQVSLLVVFPVSLFMVWVGYVDWNQVILIVIGGFLAGMAVVIQSILYLDRQLAPARRSLLPAELSPETTLIGVGQRTRQYFVISVLLLSAILAIGALGYQYIYMAGIRGADPTLVLAQYQTQLLVLGLIIFVLGIFLSSYMVRSQFQTTQELIRVMERVKGGAYSERAQIIASDETAILTVRLNQLLDQLQTSRVAMEEQVKERTQALERRSLQLQAVTQIAGEVASIPDLGTLLTRTAHLISERFGYYHTGIFLLDSTEEYAILQAASSPGGQRMLANGHRLRVGQQGVVGTAAYQNRAHVALDVGTDAVFFNNPELPLTRSEVAIPLTARTKVIGVLDLQSEKPADFSRDEISLLQSLADQIALAIQNTRLVADTQDALRRLETITFENVRRSWGERILQQKRAYQYTSVGLAPLVQSGSQEPLIDMEKGVTGHLDPDKLLQKPIEGTTRMEVPITLRGQQIGIIVLNRKSETAWNEAEKSLAGEVANQVGLALENARLLEDTERRAAQEQKLIDLTARLSRSLDPDVLLQETVRELRQLPNISEVSVYVTSPKSPSGDSSPSA
ncbi:MAG: GAF domain-containing protein [Anaerolineales bacterium]|jgi:GAF domain-containing protein